MEVSKINTAIFGHDKMVEVAVCKDTGKMFDMENSFEWFYIWYE